MTHSKNSEKQLEKPDFFPNGSLRERQSVWPVRMPDKPPDRLVQQWPARPVLVVLASLSMIRYHLRQG